MLKLRDEVIKLRSEMLKLLKIILIIMSKKTKEILFWVVMFAAFVTFICSFPSCTSTKRVEQSKNIVQNSVSEESVVAYGKEDVVIKSDETDTSVIVTLTPRVDIQFSSQKDICKDINSDRYKVKEVKIATKTTKQAITTTTNQTQKIQTKKSADLTGSETTTVKSEKQNNRNILPLFLLAFCSCCCCLFYFVFKNNNKIWK